MHWSEDPYWTDALDRYQALRAAGTNTITLDLEAIERTAFDGNGPAYRAMEAMGSVLAQEGFDGFRGAPRVMLALLVHLVELSDSAER